LKRHAAARALEEVRSGMRLGLGTGSTVAHFLDLLGEALAEGRLEDIVGVPTSEWTRARSGELGIPVTTLDETPALDLCVDGADEVDPSLDLVKGLGGALLREKMVARASARFAVIVDASKEVPRLGTLAPVPVEVTPFAWTTHVAPFAEWGADATLRTLPDGSPFVTDNGNYILHLRFRNGVPDATALDAALQARAGVVESGLFLGMADCVIVAAPEGIRVRERGGAA
jgi:ribose 5-phosphate isomerase A